ncbi:MAG: hypothetical protein Q4A62_09010 [Eikenella sp.]|nr:hypothetical protein [Eikenella sp.]
MISFFFLLYTKPAAAFAGFMYAAQRFGKFGCTGGIEEADLNAVFGLMDIWVGKNRWKPYHTRLSAIFCQCLLKMSVLPPKHPHQIRKKKRQAEIQMFRLQQISPGLKDARQQPSFV